MADTKISALTASTVPLAGTEVLPIVQGGVTKQVSVANLTAGRDTAVNTLSSTAGVWIGTTAPVYSELANILSGANSPAYSLIRNTNAGSNAYTGYYLNASGNAWAMRMGSSAANSNALEWVIDSVGAPVVRWSMTTDGNLVQGTAAKGVNFTANTPAAGMTSQLLNWYEEGTWTPTLSGFTTSGTVTATGSYRRVGSMMYIRAQISVSGGTTASTAGTSYLTSLPFVASQVGGCVTSNASTAIGLGTGSIQGGFIYPASWAATANTVIVDGTVIVA